jgi:hypothetical protein
MPPIQFVSMMMVIQMKLMKVNSNAKNNRIREFHLDMESQVIEDPNMKMHAIQFVSMMMVIQMKLMKAICNLKNMMIREFQLNME